MPSVLPHLLTVPSAADAKDVSTAVQSARQNNYSISVRGGGHWQARGCLFLQAADAGTLCFRKPSSLWLHRSRITPSCKTRTPS